MRDREAHVSKLWNPSQYRLYSRATELSQLRLTDSISLHCQAGPALFEKDNHARY